MERMNFNKKYFLGVNLVKYINLSNFTKYKYPSCKFCRGINE
jgi:hypothetical protein